MRFIFLIIFSFFSGTFLWAQNCPTTPPLLSGGARVCLDNNKTQLKLTGSVGVIQWESSPDNITYSLIRDSVAATLTIDNLNTKTYYRAVLTESTCAPLLSNVDSIVVDAVSVAGIISGGATVCAGSNSTDLQLSGYTGALQWQSSSDRVNFTSISGSVAPVLSVVNLPDTMFYRVVVTNGVCASVISGMDSILVDAVSQGGLLSGGTVVCADANKTQLQLTGYVGAIQWESSINGLNFTPVADSVASTLTITNITDTMYYRALVTNGVCTAVISNTDSILVDPVSVAGSISGGTTVCADANATILQLTGYKGTIQWQSSPDRINFTAVSDSVAPSLTINNLLNTTYFRAVLTNGVCTSSISNIDSILVNPLTIAGIVNGGSTVCTDVNSTQLSLAGFTGSIQWQQSTDKINFADITGSITPALTIDNLTNTMYYRALVKNGVCLSELSNVDSIVVQPLSVAGIVSGGTTVCAGANATELRLTGYTGNIQWQSSTDRINYTSLTDSVTSLLRIANLTDTMYYRAVVTNGVCASVQSNADSILVDPVSVAGTISGGTSVCVDANSTQLQINGHKGTIQWQSSTDKTLFANIPGSVGTSITVDNLLDTTYYRAVVTSGVCKSVNTGLDSILVHPLSISGKLTAAADTVCAAANSTMLKLTGSLGIIQWFSSMDGNNFNLINGISDSSYLTTNLAQTMYYKTIVKNGVCAAIETAPVVLNVTPVSLPGIISGAGEVCNGSNTSNLVLNDSRGDIQWQSSSNGTDFTDVLNERSLTFSVSNLNADIFYRTVVKNGICASVFSPAVKIKVNPLPAAPLAADTARCQPGVLQLTASSSAGTTIDWYGVNTGGNVLAGGSGSNLFTTPSINNTTTFYAQARNILTGCLSAARTPVQARIDAVSVAGTITGEREVCSGVNNTALILSGQRGVIQWQRSADNTLFADIQGANQSVFSAVDLTNTTYYRVSIKNGVCDALSSASVRMIVSQPSASGVITGMKAVCAENNSTILKASGTNGVIQWQSSINRTLFTDIPGANADSLQTLNLLRTTYYRVVVKNGSCVSSASTEVTMTVNPLPQEPVTQDGSRCGTGQIILRAFPPTGISNVIDWYLDSIPGSDLPIKVSSNIFVTPDVVGDRFYYAQTRNRFTGCVSKVRVAALAEIIPYAKTGTVAGDTIVCAGINQVGLKITGQEGRIQWQMSTDNINFTDIVNARTDSLTVSNLDSTHYYRVLLNADNGCNPSITDTFRILAPKPSFAGSIQGVREVCSGADSIQLNLKGYIGDIQWQSSADSLSFNDISQATDSMLTLNRITQSTFYRVKLQSGICAPDTGDIVKIIVNELPIAPESKDVVNCRVGPLELMAVAPSGATTDWYAVPVGGEILNRGQATGIYLTDTLNSTVDFFIASRNLVTGCMSADRTKITALFDPAQIPVISGDPGLCNGDSLLLKVDQTYGLQWFFNGDTLQGIKTPSVIVRKFGEYKVLFTNKSGCSNESDVKTILGYPDILGTLVQPAKTDICDGYPFQLSAGGSFGYQWFRNGVKVQDSVSSSFNASIGGVYSVQYISDKGCKVMSPDSIKLRLIKAPDAKYTIGTSTCINIPVEFLNKSVVTESGTIVYKWEFGNGKSDTGFVMKHIYEKPGLYMTRLVVTPQSCLMLADTALLYVKVESPLPAIRYPVVNAVLNKGIMLEARDFGAKYLWTPPTGLSSATVRNPIARMTQQQDFRIAITTTAGCTTTDSLLVRVFRENDIMVPEGFSPNDDGQNDRLYPFLIGIKQMNLFRVYDRWGNVVFDNKLATPSTGWNGTYKGNFLPAGAYVWMGEGIDVDDNVIRRSGTTILVR